MAMWDEIQGDWQQLGRELREQWDELTDHDLDVIAGDRDRLLGLLEDKYGLSREAAEQQIDAFCSTRAGGAGCGELAGFGSSGDTATPPG